MHQSRVDYQLKFCVIVVVGWKRQLNWKCLEQMIGRRNYYLSGVAHQWIHTIYRWKIQNYNGWRIDCGTCWISKPSTALLLFELTGQLAEFACCISHVCCSIGKFGKFLPAFLQSFVCFAKIGLSSCQTSSSSSCCARLDAVVTSFEQFPLGSVLTQVAVTTVIAVVTAGSWQ